MNNTDLADKLTSAIEAKKNDITLATWKYQKDENMNQKEVKLYSMSEEELNKCYKHCNSMLYSKNKKVPGRYKLLEIIKFERYACNAELLKRYEAIKFAPKNEDRENTESSNIAAFHTALREYLDKDEVKAAVPRESWYTTPVSIVVDVPAEFQTIPIRTVLKALSNSLGMFDARHITQHFIFHDLGVWPTKQEIKEYFIVDKNKKLNKEEQIMFNLHIKPDKKIRLNPQGLSYIEFRAMYQLKSKMYYDLTKQQLITLRDKVLYKLEDLVNSHIRFWESKKDEIEKIAELKGYKLN